MQPALASLWIGKDLGLAELACLHSMVEAGHDVTVYSYKPIANLPKGVTAADAAEIMPTDRILCYKHPSKPSPALHSNLFRYALLAQRDCIWVDLDILLLRSLSFETPWVYGLERPDSINSAILRLPRESPALARLCRFVRVQRGLPPQIRGFKRLRRMIKTFGRGRPIEEWPWGSTGPKALSLYLHESGEWRHALPIPAFYAVPIEEHARFLEPGRLSECDFGPETYALHLWASSLRQSLASHFNNEIPPDSLLGSRIARMRQAGFCP